MEATGGGQLDGTVLAMSGRPVGMPENLDRETAAYSRLGLRSARCESVGLQVLDLADATAYLHFTPAAVAA